MDRPESFQLEQALAAMPKEQRRTLAEQLHKAHSALTEADIAIDEISGLLDAVSIREETGIGVKRASLGDLQLIADAVNDRLTMDQADAWGRIVRTVKGEV